MRIVAIHKLQSKNRIEHVCFSLMNDKIQLAKGVLIIIIYYLLLIINYYYNTSNLIKNDSDEVSYLLLVVS